MLEQLAKIKDLLKDDSLRPQQRQAFEDEYKVLKRDIRDMYFDWFNIIKS